MLVLTALSACAPSRPTGIFYPPAADNATEPELAAPETFATSAAPYLIRTADQIDVKFPFRPDFNETFTIPPDGKIVLPFVGPISAAGKSPAELTSELETDFDNLNKNLPPPTARHYNIRVGDVIDLKNADEPQLDETVTVRPDGRISLVFVGSVIAEGKTPEQLEAELRRGLSKFTSHADVTVIMHTMNTHQFVANNRTMVAPLGDLDNVQVVLRAFPPPRYYVGGEVLRPSELPYSGPISILQALFAAGGATPSGELRTVVVLRKGDDGRPMIIVHDLKAEIDGTAKTDFTLKPFDIVYVPKTQIAKVQDFLNNYLYSLFPMLKNSSLGFSFLYDINPSTSTTTTTTP